MRKPSIPTSFLMLPDMVIVRDQTIQGGAGLLCLLYSVPQKSHLPLRVLIVASQVLQLLFSGKMGYLGLFCFSRGAYTVLVATWKLAGKKSPLYWDLRWLTPPRRTQLHSIISARCMSCYLLGRHFRNMLSEGWGLSRVWCPGPSFLVISNTALVFFINPAFGELLWFAYLGTISQLVSARNSRLQSMSNKCCYMYTLKSHWLLSLFHTSIKRELNSNQWEQEG